MNPCFWCATGICPCEGCDFEVCEDFIDINSPRGHEVDDIYQLYIQEAFAPVREKMKRLFKFKEKVLLKGEIK